MDTKKMITHIKEHVKYPATKSELIEACNNMMDIAQSDKKWFEENLPDREYKSSSEVLDELGIK